MQLSIPYHGKKTVEVTLSEAQLLGILEPNAIPSQGEREVLHEATAGLLRFSREQRRYW